MLTPSEELAKIQKEITSLQAREAELNEQAKALATEIEKNTELETLNEQAKIDQYVQNWISENETKLCQNGFVFDYI